MAQIEKTRRIRNEEDNCGIMNKSGKNRIIRYAALAVLLALVVLAGAAAAAKAYSMYMNLCRKMDYSNETVSALEVRIGEVEGSLHKRMDDVERLVNQAVKHYDFDYSWVSKSPLIAHAMGGIDGKMYTNSREAFLYNYEIGHRVFEVDFDVTVPENALVASHDVDTWRKKTGTAADVPFTYDTFRATKIHGAYTPIDYRDVIDLMSEYPDIYVITDTKYTDQPTVMMQFAQLVRYALEKDASVLDRLIPQIYHEAMLEYVMEVYPFRSVVFTLYATQWTKESVLDFAQRTGVNFITISRKRIKDDFLQLMKDNGIYVGSHTSNDLEETQGWFDKGLDMMYTDYLTPADVKR